MKLECLFLQDVFLRYDRGESGYRHRVCLSSVPVTRANVSHIFAFCGRCHYNVENGRRHNVSIRITSGNEDCDDSFYSHSIDSELTIVKPDSVAIGESKSSCDQEALYYSVYTGDQKYMFMLVCMCR